MIESRSMWDTLNLLSVKEFWVDFMSLISSSTAFHDEDEELLFFV
jgi:hypothetical protein